jgi:hypothetical protein
MDPKINIICKYKEKESLILSISRLRVAKATDRMWADGGRGEENNVKILILGRRGKGWLVRKRMQSKSSRVFLVTGSSRNRQMALHWLLPKER